MTPDPYDVRLAEIDLDEAQATLDHLTAVCDRETKLLAQDATSREDADVAFMAMRRQKYECQRRALLLARVRGEPLPTVF